jgi:hypothetical protein
MCLTRKVPPQRDKNLQFLRLTVTCVTKTGLGFNLPMERWRMDVSNHITGRSVRRGHER